ncbi:hypothetical protein CKO42_20610 [Lamprobacter modestohalophilus]|uniref:Peptidase C14 caspase domain-containing protein n=1 Tax=Lamprobacter modestohalophilus TaxID=1064514 RepID=A0A9X1B640_9GAMM|nr:caspase family protein [Lamprobacter modestohalophilus]MBK1620789.1 hypothetical protein [Lamprobacter modestohalophilus]
MRFSMCSRPWLHFFRARCLNGFLRRLSGQRMQVLLLPTLLCAGFFSETHADIRALVVGIDDYQHASPLHGATSDAEDIEQALRTIGVKDLIKRLDSAATRDRLSADWQQLLARAKPGDMIVFSYAGHGAQEKERIHGSEEDGLDEVLLLFDFDPNAPPPTGRLYDDELHDWFVKADQRDVEVLFLADACHSGTLTRSVDPRAAKLSYRNYGYEIPDFDLEPVPDLAAGAIEDLDNVTFFAAAQEYEKVPEFMLFDANWQPAQRGALSWAFSRALEGPADENADKVLTLSELKHFLRANVRAIANSRQTPNLLPEGKDDRSLLPVASLGPSDSRSSWPKPRIKVLGNPFAVERVGRTSEHLIDATPTDMPDITFDMEKRQAISIEGDVIAHNLDDHDVLAVIEKWQALKRLEYERYGDRLSTKIIPHDGIHRRGEEVSFYFSKIEQPYFVLYSLSGDGTLYFHYPLDGDQATIDGSKPLQLGFEVTPPYGADHMVAVTSSEPLTQLIESLLELDGTQSARTAAEETLAAIRSGRRQLGLQGLYTAP